MATLTENVARVTSALDDIKNAIIDKGVTPTGKCETFADAIASIPSGRKVVVDTFVGVNGTTLIDVGFRPSIVMAELNYDATAYPVGYISYADGIVRNCMLTSLNGGRIQANTTLNIEVNSSGFEVKTAIATFVGKNCRYVAIE